MLRCLATGTAGRYAIPPALALTLAGSRVSPLSGSDSVSTPPGARSIQARVVNKKKKNLRENLAPYIFGIKTRQRRERREEARLAKAAPSLVTGPISPFTPGEIKVPIYSMKQEVRGEIALNPDVFNQPVRPDIVHRCVLYVRNKMQQGTHKTKTRAEVSGSGRKRRPQKGQGRARMSTNRAPHHVGGGRAHGPVPHSHATDLPLKVRILGMKVMLSAKRKEGNLAIIRNPVLDNHKTAHLHQLMKPWELDKGNRALLLADEKEIDPNLLLACRRYDGLTVVPDHETSVFEILSNRRLFLTPKAVDNLTRRLTTPVRPPRYLVEAADPFKNPELVAPKGQGVVSDEVLQQVAANSERIVPDNSPAARIARRLAATAKQRRAYRGRISPAQVSKRNRRKDFVDEPEEDNQLYAAYDAAQDADQVQNLVARKRSAPAERLAASLQQFQRRQELKVKLLRRRDGSYSRPVYDYRKGRSREGVKGAVTGSS